MLSRQLGKVVASQGQGDTVKGVTLTDRTELLLAGVEAGRSAISRMAVGAPRALRARLGRAVGCGGRSFGDDAAEFHSCCGPRAVSPSTSGGAELQGLIVMSDCWLFWFASAVSADTTISRSVKRLECGERWRPRGVPRAVGSRLVMGDGRLAGFGAGDALCAGRIGVTNRFRRALRP